jgi:hypothetical protein
MKSSISATKNVQYILKIIIALGIMDVDVGKRVLPTQAMCTLLDCPVMGKRSLECSTRPHHHYWICQGRNTRRVGSFPFEDPHWWQLSTAGSKR